MSSVRIVVESVAVRQEENVLYKAEKSPRFQAVGFMQQFCKWVSGWITSVSEVKSPASSWTLVAFFQAVRCVSARLLRYSPLCPYRNLRQLIFVLKAGTIPYEHLEGCQLSTVATDHVAAFPLIFCILLCHWIGIVLHKERTISGLPWEADPGYPLLKIIGIRPSQYYHVYQLFLTFTKEGTLRALYWFLWCS